MPLRSMTGFARSQGSLGTVTWHWEVRSVNGRSLDIRMRLPSGSEAIDAAARDLVGKRISRGSVNVALTASRAGSSTVIRLNEAALQQVNAAATRARELCDAAPATLDGMLALRGVLEVAEASETEAEEAARNEAMLASLAQALDALLADRAREGDRLARVFAAQIDEVETLTRAVEHAPQRSPDRIEARLKEQVQRLFAASAQQLDRDRLHQEAMLLALKADVEEELQRLKSHVEEARAVLAATEPVGRKLDFLAQEFFREANTLCSKSNDAEITRMGLSLKAVIDQLREQVQNIE